MPYTGTGAKRGWFIDLYQAGASGFRSGDRVLGEPRVDGGVVIFTAFQPIGSECNPGGKNWLYAFNAATGANGLTLANWPGRAAHADAAHRGGSGAARHDRYGWRRRARYAAG